MKRTTDPAESDQYMVSLYLQSGLLCIPDFLFLTILKLFHLP